jgi:hypothetical protein
MMDEPHYWRPARVSVDALNVSYMMYGRARRFECLVYDVRLVTLSPTVITTSPHTADSDMYFTAGVGEK